MNTADVSDDERVCFPNLDEQDYQLPVALTDRLLSPSVVIHMDKVRRNIDQVIQICAGHDAHWVPHLKTTKIPQVWRCLLDKGLREFKCSTSKEARVFLDLVKTVDVSEPVHLLVAYPVCGPMLQAVVRLAATAPGNVRMSVLCDTLDAVEEVPAGVGVYIDLNPGMDRTGVHLDENGQWMHNVLSMAATAGNSFRGIHSYEGHLLEEHQDECEWGYQKVSEMVYMLSQHSIDVGHVITSGSDTFANALKSPYLLKIRSQGIRVSASPGICVFHDYRSDLLKPATRNLEAAAVVMARVVSIPAPGKCCLSAGLEMSAVSNPMILR